MKFASPQVRMSGCHQRTDEKCFLISNCVSIRNFELKLSGSQRKDLKLQSSDIVSGAMR